MTHHPVAGIPSEVVTVDTSTPPTLAVVIGGVTRTMTCNATDSTSTKLQFDYTVLAADVDDDAVSFGEDAVTGTITRTSDSKAADLEFRAVADDPDATVNSPPEVQASISVPDASVAEGSSATVTVTLSADPKRTVVIPITTTNAGGASDDNDSGVPENVTFNDGETTKTFTFMAIDDTDADHGASVSGNRV